jgi:hypothetical protein
MMDDGWLAEKLKDLQAPADHLIKTAKKTQKDPVIADWPAKMRSAVKEATEAAMEVLKERSTNYTIDEVEDDIDVFEERGQGLAELLKVAKASHQQWPILQIHHRKRWDRDKYQRMRGRDAGMSRIHHRVLGG